MKIYFLKRGKSPEYMGIFILWNLLLSSFSGAAVSHPSVLKRPQRFQKPKTTFTNNMQSEKSYHFSGSTNWMMTPMTPPSRNYIAHASSTGKIRRKKEPTFQKLLSLNLGKKQECDGKTNMLQDIGIIAIVLGGAGTLAGIFSASYFSVLGNMISVISSVFSFVIGIPSAIITYLAASDRVSYAIGNALSVLSFANTFYGMWSIDIGNKDIILSQIGNFIGVVSLILSVFTTFPDLFDEAVNLIGYTLGIRRELNNFVRSYGCTGSLTLYQYIESVFGSAMQPN